MSLKLFTLSLCLIVTTSGYNRETNVSVDILALSDETLGVDDEFKFKCNATFNATISLVIDGIYNNTKLDRIVSRSVPLENAVEYTFQYTTAYDNGTTFMCHAETPNKKNNQSHSEILTIQIQYAPYFEQGNNVTILQQFYKGKDGTLDCSVLMANPQIMPLKFTNTSKNSSNVHTKVTGEKGEITFSNATIDNKGKYSCIATNAIGSTTLTYITFVGGAPDKLEVIPAVAVANESLLIGLELNDESDAPALSLSFSIEGLIGEKVIWFQNYNYSIPVRHLSIQEVDQSLKFVDAGNYNLIVNAFNQLGNLTVLNETYYIPGINLDVDIESSMQNVTRGNNYSFTCLTIKPDINFTVLVDYNVNSSKANRIFKGKTTTKSQEFIFTNTSYRDNGTVFQCVAEHVYKSDANYMTVLYPPVYFNATGQLSMIYGTKNATVNMFKYTSNPKITKFTWMKDGKEIKSTNLVTVINETALMFNPPLKDDKGTYTVTAENNIGSGNGSAILDVLWAPELVSPVQLPTLRAGNTKFEVTLNISANPRITYTRWMQNGHDVTNITNISPGLFTMTFTFLTHSDNGSYSAIVFNDVGNLTVHFDMMVLWAPELVTPVQLPTLKAGDTTFVVKLNISANPGITYTCWMQNGHDVTNITNISPGLTTMTFTSLTPYDNGSYSAIVFNDVGNLTVYFDLMVLWAPELVTPVQLPTLKAGNITFVVKLNISANPGITRTQWIQNGHDVTNITNISPGLTTMTFTSLTHSDNGSYSAIVFNDVGNLTVYFDLMVLWAPELVTPVQLPTLKAGNTTFVVKLNISANPGITRTQWMQNGHDVTNITNISPGLTTMTFTSLTPYDNGSYSAIVFNDMGNLTVYFDLMVLYAPIITLPSRLGAFLNSTFVFNVSVCANPTNYTIQFMKDGKELKPSDNLHIDKNVLTFKPISNSDDGNYTVKVTNIVGSTEEAFTLHVYDGPFFEQGAVNTTVLTEMRSGSDVNLTCTIKSSSPPVTDLMIIPNNGTNFKTENNGVKSVTLIVNKAEAKSNTRHFTCKAINEFTTSTLTFDNYVGGVPDKLHVEVVITDDSDKQTFKFTFNVTDDSSAPATGLLVHLEGSTKGNKSLTIQKPPLKGASITFKDAIEENYSHLEGDTGIINMYGVNKIGTFKLKDYKFSYPTAPPKTKNDRSKDIKIALGVSIPILVLVIIAVIAAIAVGFFYYKKKSSATSDERSPLMGASGKTIQE